MERPAKTEPPDLWEFDGSLRDVYVHRTGLSDWRAFMDVVGHYPHEYFRAGDRCTLSDVEVVVATREVGRSLHIHVGTAQVNCHFFDVEEIELDIDPREVRDIETHNLILEFLESLANAVQKAVAVTAENTPTSPYLTYDPSTESWSVHEPQFKSSDA
jgi:hypothetical protein